MKQKYTLAEIHNLDINIKKPSIIYLYGDLGAGKTTLAQAIISQFTSIVDVTSPTYVYYNKYKDTHHFDLYRMQEYDEFVSIGGEEILDNNEGIILIEWPELLVDYYEPDIAIKLEKLSENERSITIKYYK